MNARSVDSASGKNPKGSTLIETTIAIFVMGMLILVLIALVNGIRVNHSSLVVAQATSLAQEELEALRNLPYASLAVQNNAPFLGVLPNVGQWAVRTGGSSAPNRLELTPTPSATSGITGTLSFPIPPVSDATVSAKLLERSGAAGTWQIGLWLRTSDARSGYLVYLEATQLKLVKRVATTTSPFFTETTLTPYTQAFPVDTWHTLSVAMSGSTLTVTVNGSSLTPVTDATFARGSVALYGGNGALGAFDDLTVSSPTGTWNFDANTVGALPTDFMRIGLNDLLDTTPTVANDNGLITIENQGAAPSPDNLKKFTSTVQWRESSGTKSVTLTTYRAKYGLF